MKSNQFTSEKALYRKFDLLCSLLETHHASFLLIEGQENYSWLTGGRGFIGLASTQACASMLISFQSIAFIANEIEIDRLKSEQKTEHPLYSYYSYPWYESGGKERILQSLTKGKKVLLEGELSSQLSMARTTFTDDEISEYEDVCITTALELESACKNIKKGMSEYELAGALSSRFWKQNLEPITLLIGFDERAIQYRHPVPHGAILDNYALVAVCTRRNGLIASATRLVSIQRDPVLMERQKISTAIESFLISQTRTGTNLKDIFSNLQSRYAELGVADEWKKHHQGGLTGYIAREVKASFDTHHFVRLGEAYGWNPSVMGTKAENTIVVEKEGPRKLTHTDSYPYLKHIVDNKAYYSEDILILSQ